MSQKRDHFRIVFPLDQRPCLSAGLGKWEIIDLSEHGAKLVVPVEGTSLLGSEQFQATIRFRDGTTAAVTAIVQRQEANEVVLQFLEELPYSLIMAEQRRLLRLYPRETLM
jgi:hypothetical protein